MEKDNIGGLVSPEFISVSGIANMTLTDDVYTIILKNNTEWLAIPVGKYGVTANIQPSETDAGIVYSVNISIQIPRQNVDVELMSLIRTILKGGIIFRYKIFSGDKFILGSPRFPLRGKIEVIHAQQASGFSGCRITLTGKQLVQQLKEG